MMLHCPWIFLHVQNLEHHFGIFINQSVLAAKQHPALHFMFGTEEKNIFQTVRKTTPQTNKTKVTLQLHQGRLWLVFGLFVFAQEKDLR